MPCLLKIRRVAASPPQIAITLNKSPIACGSTSRSRCPCNSAARVERAAASDASRASIPSRRSQSPCVATVPMRTPGTAAAAASVAKSTWRSGRPRPIDEHVGEAIRLDRLQCRPRQADIAIIDRQHRAALPRDAKRAQRCMIAAATGAVSTIVPTFCCAAFRGSRPPHRRRPAPQRTSRRDVRSSARASRVWCGYIDAPAARRKIRWRRSTAADRRAARRPRRDGSRRAGAPIAPRAASDWFHELDAVGDAAEARHRAQCIGGQRPAPGPSST